ncbi:MAG: SRPBCC family protein [Polaromonas sp.]|nr:SRPBCC family protein [Polaromonas sp.]
MVNVTRTVTLRVPAERAWALLRDFNAMPQWNDTVRSSRIENGPADRVGCTRVLEFDDGGLWTHQLTGLSDEDRCLQYRITGTPQPMRVPVWNYRARICVQSLSARTENSYAYEASACAVSWRAEFETDREADMQERAGQVFERGFFGLRACLEP